MKKIFKPLTKLFILTLAAIILSGCWTHQIARLYKTLEPADGIIYKNIEYKKVPCGTTELDIYLPYSFNKASETSNVKYPLYLFIHGGAWMGGSKDMLRHSEIVAKMNQDQPITKLLPSLRKNEIAVASISYRFLQQASWSTMAKDVSDAFKFLKENESKYHIDMERVLIHGESAGAHLALQYGLVDHSKEGIKIKAIIDLFGPTDLVALSDHRGVFGDGMLNCTTMKIIPYALRYKNSPINTSYKSDVSLFIFHGDIDDLVPFNQSVLLMKKMEYLSGIKFENVEERLTAFQANKHYLLKVVKNANHGFMNKEVTPELLSSLYDMMVTYAVTKLK